jgi:hypothetical protein
MGAWSIATGEGDAGGGFAATVGAATLTSDGGAGTGAIATGGGSGVAVTGGGNGATVTADGAGAAGALASDWSAGDAEAFGLGGALASLADGAGAGTGGGGGIKSLGTAATRSGRFRSPVER